MKGSRKLAVQAELHEWIGLANENWTPTYRGMPSDVKASVQASLLAEQRGLCVYCGRKLEFDRPGKSFHIEHFRPRTSYLQLQVSYDNLFLSCGQEDVRGLPAPTCGTYKGSWFDEERHIYPSYPSCVSRFRFMLDGAVEAADPADAAAISMINHLRLNHPELSKDREDLLALIDEGRIQAEDLVDPVSGFAESYGHVAFRHEGKSMP